jgi:radical SAM protein with 4Fe4S-binding SPASM domain
MMDIKDWFKGQLRLIEIETFSYCNRKCWFCPNSSIDRISHNKEMPEEMYLSIIKQLAEIDYDKEITYSRYNEPLAYKELILKRISQARQNLPKAKLRTNTNGDYVTLEYIHELRDAGLNELFIQQYLANNESYKHDKIRKRMLTKIKALGVPYKVISDIDNHRIEYDLDIEGITVHLRARNFAVEGTARTEKVAGFNEAYVRTKACGQPFNNMYIDYNGTIMVCCNTRSDVPLHKNGVMAHVNDAPLWEIYRNEKYKPWRDHLENDGPKSGICKGCKIDLKVDEF